MLRNAMRAGGTVGQVSFGNGKCYLGSSPVIFSALAFNFCNKKGSTNFPFPESVLPFSSPLFFNSVPGRVLLVIFSPSAVNKQLAQF